MTGLLVHDELDLLGDLVPLSSADIIELGCGAAVLARRLLQRHAGSRVTALEVDERQHTKNLADPAERLAFVAAGAQAIPFQDGSFDLALMLRSLHHVPVPLMGRALAEAARVVRPRGHLYVSEPVYAGPLNDVIRLFNDEREVREAAQVAIDAALRSGSWEPIADIRFDTPVVFADFESFEKNVMRPTFADHRIDDAKLDEVRAAFMPHCGSDGAHFLRPLLVRLLRRPG